MKTALLVMMLTAAARPEPAVEDVRPVWTAPLVTSVVLLGGAFLSLGGGIWLGHDAMQLDLAAVASDSHLQSMTWRRQAETTALGANACFALAGALVLTAVVVFLIYR